MAQSRTYLNFPRHTEEIFNFYKTVFGGEFTEGSTTRYRDLKIEGFQTIPEQDKNLIVHIEFPIIGGHILMGTDAQETMGTNSNFKKNVSINLEPHTRVLTKKLFESLSNGGTITVDLKEMFWGAYYGSCTDKFGVQWMLNCVEKEV